MEKRQISKRRYKKTGSRASDGHLVNNVTEVEREIKTRIKRGDNFIQYIKLNEPIEK